MRCEAANEYLRSRASNNRRTHNMHTKKISYVNGAFIPESEAVVSVFDRGFLYGDGVFETMRAYDGRVFRIHQHIQRLRESVRLVKLRLAASNEELIDICEQLLERNEIADAIIRLSVTRGPASGGIGVARAGEPTIVAFIRPPMPIPAGAQTGGVSVRISRFCKTPSSALHSRVKSMNFLNGILARSEAEEAGAYEAVLLDLQGNITETSTANIFFVRDGNLFTPSPENDILLGITRAAVIELAGKSGISCNETVIPATEIGDFQECFLTNSAIELLPVTRVDGRPVGEGNPGPIYAVLHRAYRELVRKAD